jgi:hypothetical protein
MDVAVIMFLVLYVAGRWMWSYGIFSPNIVILPFSVHGEGDTALGTSVASSLEARLTHIRHMFSPEQERATAIRLAANLGVEGILALPYVRTFDKTAESVTLKPFELGPVTISVNRFLFDLLPKRATTITGAIERYGDSIKLTVFQDGQLSFVIHGTKPKEVAELIEQTAYQLVATNWILRSPAPWPGIKHLIDGIDHYSTFIETNDEKLLVRARESLGKAKDTATSWAVPKLLLARVLFVEFQKKRTPEAMAALEEAARLFDDVAFNSPDRELAILGRLAGLHVYSHLVRISFSRCDEITSYLSNVRKGLEFVEAQQNPAAGSGARSVLWRSNLALGNGKLALAQLLVAPQCENAAKPLLAAGEKRFDKAIEYTAAATQYFTQVQNDPTIDKEDKAVAAYNLVLSGFQRSELLVKTAAPNAEIEKQADQVEKQIKDLKFPPDLPFLRGTLAHLYLLKARQAAATDATAASNLARKATEQLGIMSFEQSGFAAEWARARKVDSLLAEGDWVGATRGLFEVLDAVSVSEIKRDAEEKGSGRKTGYWSPAGLRPAATADAAPVRILDNVKSLRAADAATPFFPADIRAIAGAKLEVIAGRNDFGILPLILAMELALDQGAGVEKARKLLQQAKDRVVDKGSYLWTGAETPLLLALAEARLLAAEDQPQPAAEKLKVFETAFTGGQIPTTASGPHNALLCAAIRVHLARKDSQKADELKTKLPPELRTLVFEDPAAGQHPPTRRTGSSGGK